MKNELQKLRVVNAEPGARHTAGGRQQQYGKWEISNIENGPRVLGLSVTLARHNLHPTTSKPVDEKLD